MLITGTGILNWLSPPPAAERVALWQLHTDLWWGLLLLAIGTFYVLKFKPASERRK